MQSYDLTYKVLQTGVYHFELAQKDLNTIELFACLVFKCMNLFIANV